MSHNPTRSRGAKLRAAIALAAIALCGIVAAALVIAGGLYNVAATEQHFAPVYHAMQATMLSSVRRRARDIVAPPSSVSSASSGAALYREHCVPCHGAPGIAPRAFALGLNPQPANLVYTARNWSVREVVWVVKHGIRMTGMPAWSYRFSDEEIWAVSAFVKRLPELTPEDYAALPPATSDLPGTGAAVGGGDPRRGADALHQYACITCHQIPGAVGATVPVGPPLDHYASRSYVAGALVNTPDELARWLRAPHAVKAHTAMPDLGMTERDARDIAAFLHSLH
ncbi:MAG TPA: c-type cytochrome [Burkholderiales bacterium]|nr:c-type cytochrome [Burkholderiales bacterium]